MPNSLPVDKEMPQVATLWDGPAMGSAVEAAWARISTRDTAIASCRVERFRYRPGVRSIVLYEVTLRDSVTGEPPSFWMTAATYADKRAKRIYARLKPLDHGNSHPPAVAYLKSLRTVVQLFPLDRYLPNLPRVLGNRDEPLREILLHESGINPGDPTACSFHPVRYRPHIACTSRVDVSGTGSDGTAQERQFYFKMYRDGESADAFEQLKSLTETIERCRCPFGVVAPLTHVPHLNGILFPHAEGESVETSLLQRSGIDHAMTKSADALAALHLSDLPAGNIRSAEGALLRARKAERFISWSLPNLRDQITGVVQQLEQRLDESLMRPAHQDVKPEHLFVAGEKVWFIDMDSTALGDPVFDAATMLARLHAMPYLSPVERGTVEQAADLFLPRYFSLVPETWTVRLGPNLACAFLKVSLFFIQHLSQDWPERVRELVQLADDSLNGTLPRIAGAMEQRHT